ncbi:MAG: radical SAM protein [Myxococcota bacterium]|nr:radical SAM protein [Myxococcota bacterium]
MSIKRACEKGNPRESKEGTESKRPLCAEPWRNLSIGNEGTYRPCCHIQLRTDKPCGTKNELLDIFNSPEMQDLRGQLASQNVTNEKCRSCLAHDRVNPAYTKDIGFEGVPSIYEDTRQRAQDSFDRGDTVVDHLPLLLTVYLSYQCNIRCIMCSQAVVKDKKMFRNYPSENLISIFEEIDGEEVPYLNLVGGEPFYSRDGVALIQHFGNARDSHVQIGVTTNGTLFSKHEEVLSKLSQANFTVSIDGFGESYEYIRDGANWNELMENIETLDRVTAKNPKVRLAEVTSIVMAASIPDLHKLVRFCADRGQTLLFVECDQPFYLENCFFYPSLLMGTSWEESMHKAIEVARELNLPITTEKLEFVHGRLREAFYSPSKNILLNEIQRIRSLFSLKVTGWQIGGRKKVRSLERHVLRQIAAQFFAWLDKINAQGEYFSREQHARLKERLGALSSGPSENVASKSSLPILSA